MQRSQQTHRRYRYRLLHPHTHHLLSTQLVSRKLSQTLLLTDDSNNSIRFSATNAVPTSEALPTSQPTPLTNASPAQSVQPIESAPVQASASAAPIAPQPTIPNNGHVAAPAPSVLAAHPTPAPMNPASTAPPPS